MKPGSRSNALLLAVFLLFCLSACGENKSEYQNFPNCRVYDLYNEVGSTDPSWSPGGDEIVFCYGGDLWIIPPSGGKASQVTSLEGQEICPEWLPDPNQRKLVFVNMAGAKEYSIYTLDLNTNELKKVVTLDTGISNTSWTRDGSQIAFLQTGKPGIYTVPAAGGEPELVPNRNEKWEMVRSAQCSPAHDYIVFTDYKDKNYRISTIPVTGGNVTTVEIIQGASAQPNYVTESHDGSTIAFCDKNATGWTNLRTIPSTGGEIKILTDYYQSDVTNPSWSPDGKRLAVQVSYAYGTEGRKTLCIVELK